MVGSFSCPFSNFYFLVGPRTSLSALRTQYLDDFD